MVLVSNLLKSQSLSLHGEAGKVKTDNGADETRIFNAGLYLDGAFSNR